MAAMVAVVMAATRVRVAMALMVLLVPMESCLAKLALTVRLVATAATAASVVLAAWAVA